MTNVAPSIRLLLVGIAHLSLCFRHRLMHVNHLVELKHRFLTCLSIPSFLFVACISAHTMLVADLNVQLVIRVILRDQTPGLEVSAGERRAS